MRLLRLSWTCFLLLLVCGAAPRCWAASIGHYTVSGMSALLQYDQAAARTRALQAAFREALEEAIADLVAPNMLTNNLQGVKSRLYAKPLAYMRSYRVLWEYPDSPQKVYRVGLEAEVAVNEVGRVLDSLGIPRRRDEVRRFAIFMGERQTAQTPRNLGSVGGIVAGVLRQELLAQGLRVAELEALRQWDGQDASALSASKKAEAKIVLIGWVDTQPNTPEGTEGAGTGLRVLMQVRALATEGGGEISHIQVETPVTQDEADNGSTQVIEKAATELATRMIASLYAYRQERRARTTDTP